MKLKDKKPQPKKYSHIIEVKVKIGKPKQIIQEKIPAKYYEVSLTSQLVANKANNELLLLLVNYFKVNLSDLHIISGLRSSRKIIKIDEHLS